MRVGKVGWVDRAGSEMGGEDVGWGDGRVDGEIEVGERGEGEGLEEAGRNVLKILGHFLEKEEHPHTPHSVWRDRGWGGVGWVGWEGGREGGWVGGWGGRERGERGWKEEREERD